MIEKCYACKTGHLTKSGSHMFCDKCNFTYFVVTQDYIDACAIILGALVSNTRFDSKESLTRVLYTHIELHLPQLDKHLSSVVNGHHVLGGAIIEAAQTQAINLQIGQEVVNEEQAAFSLRCQCGNEDFTMVSVGVLACNNCEAVYEYNEESGLYEPEFLCKCGFAAYEEVDEHLVACKNCAVVYQRTVNGFRPL